MRVFELKHLVHFVDLKIVVNFVLLQSDTMC